MSKRHSSMGGIEWKYADVRHLDDLPDKSIDVAFDKGTLDAMIHGSPWSPPNDVKDNTRQYVREVCTNRGCALLNMSGAISTHDSSCPYINRGFPLHHTIFDLLRRLLTYTIQVNRVLKDDGVFLYVTYRQPHFMRPLLNCDGTDWDIEMDILGDGTSSFAYHGFALTKKS